LKTYELTYIIADAVADDATAGVMNEVTGELERLGGVIIKEEPWGKRKLAYSIGKSQYGTYVTLQTHLEGAKVKEIERFLRLHETIIRHLLVQAVQPATKPTDEAELVEALDKRVEEKISKKPADKPEPVKTSETAKTKATALETALEPETEKAAAPKRARKVKSNEEEKKEESEAERKKQVEEKLSEILGE